MGNEIITMRWGYCNYPSKFCSKCHKIIDHIWHYLICYKLNFNLHRNNIQLHALIKYTMLITCFLECLNFHQKYNSREKIALYITLGIYI